MSAACSSVLSFGRRSISPKGTERLTGRTAWLRTKQVNPGTAVALLDQLQPRRLGLRLVADSAGQVGAEQRVDEVPNATALLAPVDGAHGLELAHHLGHMIGGAANGVG